MKSSRGLQCHRLTPALSDLVPFQRVQHDDGWANLEPCQSQPLPLSIADGSGVPLLFFRASVGRMRSIILGGPHVLPIST